MLTWQTAHRDDIHASGYPRAAVWERRTDTQAQLMQYYISYGKPPFPGRPKCERQTHLRAARARDRDSVTDYTGVVKEPYTRSCSVSTKVSSATRSLKWRHVDHGQYENGWPQIKTERCEPGFIRWCGLACNAWNYDRPYNVDDTHRLLLVYYIGSFGEPVELSLLPSLE
jgi:hypothetical protein